MHYLNHIVMWNLRCQGYLAASTILDESLPRLWPGA